MSDLKDITEKLETLGRYTDKLADMAFQPTPKMDISPPPIQNQEIPHSDYNESMFKDLANDIKQVQSETNKRLDNIIEESNKSERFNKRIIVATLIVSILTLGATIIGIFV